MGRYYKTAKPEMIDFMHKLPEKALFAAVDQADKQYEDQAKYVTDLEKYLKLNAQEADVSRKDELLKEADAKIKEFTHQLHTSPSAALKSMGEIRSYGQQLHENYTRGEMAGIQGAYDAEEAWVKQETERMTKEKGRVLTSDIEEFRRVFNEQYNKPIYEKIIDPKTGLESKGKLTGYGGGLKWDATKGKGQNSFITENIANYIDAEDVATKAVAHWKEDSEKTHNTEVKGNYILSTIDGSIVANANDIYNTSYNALKNNEELMARYNQRIKHGLMSKEDLYGKIDPDTGEHVGYPKKNEKTGKVEIDPRTGKPEVYRDEFGNVIPVKGGILYETAMGTAEEFGFNRTEKGITGLQETEETKQRAKLRADKELYDYTHPVPKIDVTRSQVKLNAFSGVLNEFGEMLDKFGIPTTVNSDDIVRNNKESNEKLATQGKDFGKNMSEALIKAANPTAALEFNTLWGKALETGDFSKVSEFVSENDIGIEVNGQPFGNGVKQFAQTYGAEKVKLNNEHRFIANIWEEEALSIANEIWEAMDGTERGSAVGNNNMTFEQGKQKFLQEKKDRLIKSYNDSDNKGRLNNGLRKKVDERLVNVSKGSNVGYTEIKSGVSNPNISREDQSYLARMFSMYGNQELVQMLGSDGSAKAYVGGNTSGAPITLQQLFNNENLSFDTFGQLSDDGTVEVLGLDGKKKSVTMKSDLSVIPENIPGVGANARCYTVVLQVKDKETGKHQAKEFKIMMPEESITFDQKTEDMLSDFAAEAAGKNLAKQGTTLYGTSEYKLKNVNSEKQFIQPQEAPECKYFPTATSGGKEGKYEMPDFKGGVKIGYGEEGRAMYVAYLKATGKVSSNYKPSDGTENRQLSGKISYESVPVNP